MRVGRRALRFWIYLFAACGTGCAGCGNCFDFGGGSGGDCNVGKIEFGCDGGLFCSSSTDYDASYPQLDGGSRGPIRTGLVAPGGLATDGSEIFFVDDGVLTQIEPDGSNPIVLATGVDASGGLASDGTVVFWAGGWSGNADGGAADAGDDGGVEGGSDAGDGGGPIASNPGIYAIPVGGGDIAQITTATVLPTLAIDDFHAYARVPLDDAGSSSLEAIAFTDGGVASLATLTKNTGNMHAFALGPDDVVALDDSDIVSVLLDGGGKSTLEVGAAAAALLETDFGTVSIAATPPVFSLHLVGQASSVATRVGDVAAIAAWGRYVYVADSSWGTVFQFDASDLSVPVAVASWNTTSTVSYMAADDRSVYLVTVGPSGGAITRETLF